MHLNMILSYVDKSVRAINTLAMASLFVIMIMTMIGVIGRILGMPISGITNLSESLLVITIYMGVAYTQQMKKHVSVELLVGSVSEKAAYYLNCIVIFFSLIISSLICISTWDFALKSLSIMEKMDGEPFFPIYPPKIAVAIGFTLLCFQLISDFIREVKRLIN